VNDAKLRSPDREKENLKSGIFIAWCMSYRLHPWKRSVDEAGLISG
jgi:hypothetical protein